MRCTTGNPYLWQPEPGKQPDHSLGTPSGCPTDWVHLRCSGQLVRVFLKMPTASLPAMVVLSRMLWNSPATCRTLISASSPASLLICPSSCTSDNESPTRPVNNHPCGFSAG